MLRSCFAILGLMAVAACADPEPPTRCQCISLDVGLSGCRKPWPLYNEGLRWHTSLEEALKIAREQDKLVFYFLVVGDLDKEEC